MRYFQKKYWEEEVMMKTVDGIYASAKIFTDQVEQYAIAQIQMLCDNEMSKGSTIRVMPDVHPGKVGTIGLTMTIGDRILPNLVGIDIGCGMTIAPIKGKKIEYQKLDKVIREKVPAGSSLRKSIHRMSEEFDFQRLHCVNSVDVRREILGLGTLGGGNHFIEIDQDEKKQYYAVVHSGSRHLGQCVTEYYLREGQKILKEQGIQVPFELTYLTGDLMQEYLQDQLVVQEYAELNRRIILEELSKGMKWKWMNMTSCVHNYIEQKEENCILRKGAISAKLGETVVIPINMKEGILLGAGLGNKDWNESAPHGSGRVYRRDEVQAHYTVSDYKAEMKGIYSSCIGKETLDEAPFAYIKTADIVENIQDTVAITAHLKPVYNYKAGGK